MERSYSEEPDDAGAFTQSHDRAYTRFAALYDLAVKALPVWKAWLRRALPHIRGPRVLETSFGTGYLLTQYAGRFETHGLDYNHRMVEVARRNLAGCGLAADLLRGDAHALPYRDACFDTVLNTMAFSGYADAKAALGEMRRVLRPGGRIVMIDVGYPTDGNWLGTRLASAWKLTGDLLRDMDALFHDFSLDASHEEIGGWGSIHLYVATKGRRASPLTP